ncbi:MAG: DNA-directed RNA polymerase subunit alpha [bacterium]
MIRFYPITLGFGEISEDKSYSRFVISPLARGYGVTLGNALRRVLLSSIEGAAFTYIEINGQVDKSSGSHESLKVLHEFTTLPNVLESVTEFVLNLRALPVRVKAPGPKVVHFNVKGYKEVHGEDIVGDPDVLVTQPDHYVMTLEKGTSLRVEIGCMRGRGYVTAENHWPGDLREDWRDLETFPAGVIPLDTDFQPVKKVTFHVDPVRVGRSPDHEKLTLEVWTNGTVTAEEALKEAVFILSDQMAPLKEALQKGTLVAAEGEELAREKLLERDIASLNFSKRTHNLLSKNNIFILGDLVSRSMRELRAIPLLGRKAIMEVEEKLEKLNLSLRSDSE